MSAPSGDHGGLRGAVEALADEYSRDAIGFKPEGWGSNDVDRQIIAFARQSLDWLREKTTAALAAHPVPEPAQVGEVGAVLAEHTHPGEIMTALTEAWLTCGCGERVDVPVRDLSVSHSDVDAAYAAHLAAVLVAAGVIR